MANSIDRTCKPMKRALLVWVSRNTNLNTRDIVDNFNDFWHGRFTDWRCFGNGFDNLHNTDGKIHVTIDPLYNEGNEKLGRGDYRKEYVKKLKKVDLINASLDNLISEY